MFKDGPRLTAMTSPIKTPLGAIDRCDLAASDHRSVPGGRVRIVSDDTHYLGGQAFGLIGDFHVR